MLTWMPGKSHQGPRPPLTEDQQHLRDELAGHVRVLTQAIGERSLARPRDLELAADYLARRLREAGYGEPQRQVYEVGGDSCVNLWVERPGSGRAEEIVLIGAHYDSIPGTVGANDNASGVAAVLALAHRLAQAQPSRTLRFTFFTNEEPPYFHGPMMGSYVYARRCRERGEKIVAMLSLDGIGCFRDEEGSQQYPIPVGGLYPSRGDFVGFVSNLKSVGLLRRTIGAFRRQATVASEGAALPGGITGVGFSDHWSFWEHGYPALLVTDTLPFRDPHYHTVEDTLDKLDLDRMTRVVDGLEDVLRELAG